MRRLSLYPKLAASALKKNIRIYLPYLLACTGTVLMFNLLYTLTIDGEVTALRGGAEIQMVLTLGCVVVAVFSAILLFYTNGVIIRQRKREFGLYNILGMEKRHIGLVLLWETLYTALIAFAGGIAGAFVFSKLVQMLLMHMLGGEVNLRIGFQPAAALGTLGLFLAIFLLTLIKNLTVIARARPTELLRSANEGEREPRSRWILALLGVICLGAGYYISLRTDDVYNAVMMFFVAVLLVIAGTYLLFTAFSIVLLKALRRNKNYYYKTNHFVAVSGMLYRMKRNAMGLASICILSTMVLVTISTTFSLYLGMDEVLNTTYPTDVSCEMRWMDSTEEERAEARKHVKEMAGEYGLGVKDEQVINLLSFAAPLADDGVSLDFNVRSGVGVNRILYFAVMSMEDYAPISDIQAQLQPGEALAYVDGSDNQYAALKIGDLSLALRPLEDMTAAIGRSQITTEVIYLVVDSLDTLKEIDEIQRAAYDLSSSYIYQIYCFNLDGPEDQKIAYQEAAIAYGNRTCKAPSHVNARQLKYYEDYVSMYGSMFFLGMFLGFLFIMTTVTIMYYKQVSEGMDDCGRYAIMQKVGMTRAEVRSAIRSQVLTVFFLPLVTAAVHVIFAFPMVRYILRAFGMVNTGLFASCTLGCFGVFAALYIVVYLLTARAYYRIVDGKQG